MRRTLTAEDAAGKSVTSVPSLNKFIDGTVTKGNPVRAPRIRPEGSVPEGSLNSLAPSGATPSAKQHPSGASGVLRELRRGVEEGAGAVPRYVRDSNPQDRHFTFLTICKFYICLSFVLSFFVCNLNASYSSSSLPEAFPSELEAELSAGTTAIYHLNFDFAENCFLRAIRLQPEHPAAYFFLLMSTWYRLTYDSLVNRDPILEKLLLERAELTIEKAKAFSKNVNTQSVGYLYWGGALGAKGWYHVLRSQWVRAYFSGKKGYAYLQKVITLDPGIYDAYLGIGMYEYYAATLGPTLKMLASFSIRGDKTKALHSLYLAEMKGKYVRLEAAYFLWNTALEEGRFEEALEKIKILTHTFPDSPLFRWCEIQTLYAQQKWDEVIKKGEEFASFANIGPQPQGYVSPYELLMSKVLYHCGMAAFRMRNIKLAKSYFEKAVDQPGGFHGWKVLSYLRRGELFDMEGKRVDALGRYRVVLRFPDVWDSRKIARQRIKEPYRGE